MNRPSSSISNPPPRAAGFTLLEVLLAITVGAVVLVAINGVFFSALRLRERTTRLIESALPVQRALNLVTRDLASLVPPGTTMSGALSPPMPSMEMIFRSAMSPMRSRVTLPERNQPGAATIQGVS